MGDEDSNRPSIGFPLGLVLLLLMFFIMSGIFTCCLHWEKVLYLFGASRDQSHIEEEEEEDVEHSPRKSAPPQLEAQINQGQSLPVLMPGDQVPKFIAMACPCAPPVTDQKKITVQVRQQKPPSFPVPLY